MNAPKIVSEAKLKKLIAKHYVPHKEHEHDPHSELARDLDVTRYEAKNILFRFLYGGIE